jgi:hypothetical protein
MSKDLQCSAESIIILNSDRLFPWQLRTLLHDYFNSISRKFVNSLLTFSKVTCPDKAALLLVRMRHGRSGGGKGIEGNRWYY